MPRKYHRDRKPSLIFEESPVSVQAGHVSPVLAAENPPKAEVVAIDDDFEPVWVSPQFSGISAGPKKPLQKTRHRSKKQTENNTTCHQKTYIYSHRVKSKHPKNALTFVGDVPRSPLQEFTLNESDSIRERTPHSKNSSVQKQKTKPDLVSKPSPRKNCELGLKTKHMLLAGKSPSKTVCSKAALDASLSKVDTPHMKHRGALKCKKLTYSVRKDSSNVSNEKVDSDTSDEGKTQIPDTFDKTLSLVPDTYDDEIVSLKFNRKSVKEIDQGLSDINLDDSWGF